MRRLKILFFGEGVTLAHVARPLAMAEALDRNRHWIGFACAKRYARLPAESGFPVYPLRTLPSEEFLRRLARGRTLYSAAELSGYVAEERKLLEALRPDLAVGDFRVSLSVSCELAGVPLLTLCNGYWSPYSTIEFPLPEIAWLRAIGPALAGRLARWFAPVAFRAQARGYNAVRKGHGLAPVRSIREMYTGGTWTGYLDLPDLAPVRGAPGNHFYVGPPTWEPRGAEPAWWADALADDRPLVYLTLGSSGDMAILGAVLAALGRLPVQVAVATAGRRFSGVMPGNARAADYLPGRQVLGQARLCVCNGGATTGYQALAAGVPILALPSNADQFYFAESVCRYGAGLLLRPSRLSERVLIEALERLLDERAGAPFRAAAGRLGEAVRGMRPERRFARFVENFAGRQAAALPAGAEAESWAEAGHAAWRGEPGAAVEPPSVEPAAAGLR